ncbi:hypothetical protein ACWGOQ_0016470 [Aquimarina sp. M1]
MRYVTTLFILFVIYSCDVSLISDKNARNIKKLKAYILIHDGDKEKELNYIKVIVSDGKKKIINEDIKIIMNGSPLYLYIKDELYFTKTSYYTTDDVVRSDSYYFEIVLPDKTKYPLAYIKPIQQKKKTTFEIPLKASRDEGFSLSWRHLYTPAELEILKGVKYKNKTTDNSTKSGYDRKRTDTLKTEIGEYVIPTSYFEDSLTIATHFSIRLNQKESGLTNPKLLSSSKIIYNYSFEKRIEFIEKND